MEVKNKENAVAEMNIYQKLEKIRQIADVAKKDKQGFGYKYASPTEILAKVRAGMDKYHISLLPNITPGTMKCQQNVIIKTKNDKAGNTYEQRTTEMLVSADMIFRWVNNDNPEQFVDVPWTLVGAQEDPSQAFGSGLSYCTRYFMKNYFQIPEEEDVDAYRSKQKEAEAAEEKMVTEGIIAKIDTAVREYLSSYPAKAAAVKDFCKRYESKSGNYMAIKSARLAAKMLEDFNNTFVKEN